ncbi:MAG: DUF2184 domain-containing protein [Pseudomonadota bacterium]
MAAITPSFTRVSPSYVMPEWILQYQQASGAFELLAGGDPLIRLSEGDQYVYGKTLFLKTEIAVGQVAYNQLPSVSMEAAQIRMPTYLMRVRAEYDHHDTAAAGVWDLPIDNAFRLGMRQGIFQGLRDFELYGVNPQNGEGLVNAAGATAVSLPPDSNGNQTLVTYDNGQLGIYILSLIQALKTRTNQFGMASRVVITAPQRVLGTMELTNIVQLTQFQRDGAGSATTMALIKDVVEKNGDSVEWTYDDTLIGKGAGGTDMFILSVPEIKKPVGGQINTNEFAGLAPGLSACLLMFADMAAPREIRTPLPGGAIDIVSEMRATPGWAIRPEALTLLSIQYQ